MNTTHTKELTEPSEKPKAGQFLETISLRDYFAAQALQALIIREGKDCSGVINEITTTAYQYADDMMKARQE